MNDFEKNLNEKMRVFFSSFPPKAIPIFVFFPKTVGNESVAHT
jgi:hypothetical protein